jgi:hypothetical protein
MAQVAIVATDQGTQQKIRPGQRYDAAQTHTPAMILLFPSSTYAEPFA